MQLYNTLTRNIEKVTPLHDNTVRIYSCGPTVYDHAHIGNLSAYIFADTLRRAVTLAGHDVKHVMNYTDVDDKTIRRSRETYPGDDPHAALKKLTNTYIVLFLEDMQKLGNNTEALTFVRATDTIDGMKQLITRLHAGGFAYIADDGVYFSIEAYRKSGKTYGQLLKLTVQNTSAARIQNDEYDKESVHDFALWKTQKEGEPAWEFTLGGQNLTGRPGWHVECSVMSRQELDQPFDIHTGGVDLIFPHHENEIAQSTALEKNPVMASIFAHNEHILVDGKKMSKSAQNFYTLEDVVQKGFDPLAFRLLVLQAHYRNQVNFTWESLEAAQNRLKHWLSVGSLVWQVKNLESGSIADQISRTRKQLRESLSDDLNTPEVLKRVDQMMAILEGSLISQNDRAAVKEFFEDIEGGLGIALTGSDITGAQKALIAERQQARDAQNWTKSDELRGTLAEQGIGVRDTPHGAIWHRL